MLVALFGVSVATVATDLATSGSRDSSVYVPAIQDHYNCEQPSEGWGVLALVFTHSVGGTSGFRECESSVVVLVLFLGGLANIGQVAISL